MPEKEKYVLGYDEDERKRLNSQHEWFVQTTGYLLHPLAKRHAGPESWIADIGTGTGTCDEHADMRVGYFRSTSLANILSGAWLLVTNDHVSANSRLVGFDVSAAAFPSPDCHPPNVEFHIADFKRPFEPQWHGKFDIVHARMVSIAIAPPEYEEIAQNMKALLKPDGVLQWEEPNLRPMHRILRDTAPADCPEYLELTHNATPNWTLGQFGSIIHDGAANGVSKALPATGFGKIFLDRVSTDRLPDSRYFWTMNYLDCLEKAIPLISDGRGAAFEQSCFKQLATVTRAVDAGCYLRCELCIFVAFLQ